MNSKYIKLPEKTMRMKLEKLDRTFLSMITIDRICCILEDYDQTLAADLAFKAETEILEAKKVIKAKEDEEKKVKEQEKLKDDEETFEEVKREFDTIISHVDFVGVKNAFGVVKKDEDDKPLFSSLTDQFLDHISNTPNLRYMRCVSTERPTFNESMAFKFLNTNTGMPLSFEGFEKVFFICFRLYVYPTTNECRYESLWIINTNESLSETVIPFDYKYFEWEEVLDSERQDFISKFLKLDLDVNTNCKSEVYFR